MLNIGNLTSDVQKAARAYIEAAYWTDNSEDNPVNSHVIADDAMMEAVITVAVVAGQFPEMAQVDPERFGHDLWLTQNGHGAGFWDGDWPEGGEAITEFIQKNIPSKDFIVGDDGLCYFE